MSTSIDSLAILTDARPADLELPDAAVRARVYQSAISAQAIPQRRRSSSRRYVITATGAAAVASLLVAMLALQPFRTVSPEPRPTSHPAPADISASAVLLATAAVVGNEPLAPVGTYWHTSLQVFEIGTTSYPSNTVDFDNWIARDPNGRSWYTMSSSKGHSPISPADSTDPLSTRFDVDDRFLTFDELQQLPADPAALEAYLLAIPPHHPKLPPVSVSDRLFGAAVDLAKTPALPAVRATAFRLLAGLAGLTSLGQVTDPLGRAGVGVENAYSDGVTVELIVNRTTGSFLALENVSTVDGQATITSYNALIQEGWTNTVATVP